MANPPTRFERWFKRCVQLTLVALIIGLVWWKWPEQVVAVRSLPVQRGSVEEIVPSTQAGEVKSRRQVDIRSVTAGRVTAVRIAKGDRVKAGQVLVELDGASLAARLRLARANLNAGKSALRSAQVRRAAAHSNLDRSKKLAASGAMSAGALERFQTEYDMASEAMASGEATIAQLQAAVEVAQSAFDEIRILAPFDGLVTRVHVELGEVVAPASPVLDLVDDSSVTVEAPIDEADLGRLRPGLDVRVETDAHPDAPFMGKLTYISPVVLKDLRQNRSLVVEVSLNGAADRFRVGMSADIEIVVDLRTDTLYVPTAAVIRKGDKRQVYVVLAGSARLREIKLGLTNWDRTEVLEGLREGEQVVVSLDAVGLADGVQVMPEGSSAAGRAAF